MLLYSYKVRNKNFIYMIYEEKGEISVIIINYIIEIFDVEFILFSFLNFFCFYDY